MAAFIAILISVLLSLAYSQNKTSCGINSVMIVVLENRDESEVLQNAYMTQLKERCYYLSNMFGVSHPSQPNYLAMISGSTQGCIDDSDVDYKTKSIVDLLEAKGLTWKSYQEDYPGSCFTGSAYSQYRRKHNPFISFTNIRENATRCANIINSSQLDIDASNDALPNYMFYTPGMDDDGHDTTVDYAASWLQKFLEPKLVDPAYSTTLFMITHDESRSVSPNHIYTVLIGAGIKGVGFVDETYYDHYSLLATTEALFGLGCLDQNDATASKIPLSDFCGYVH
ncbi:hypothetical protein HDU79_002968 [Rhizoclosmatium sp. JEL0117]|nr:hypothetical protein HDU79_002968 [Rhizoclosmatium sp. JEL0117]